MRRSALAPSSLGLRRSALGRASSLGLASSPFHASRDVVDLGGSTSRFADAFPRGPERIFLHLGCNSRRNGRQYCVDGCVQVSIRACQFMSFPVLGLAYGIAIQNLLAQTAAALGHAHPAIVAEKTRHPLPVLLGSRRSGEGGPTNRTRQTGLPACCGAQYLDQATAPPPHHTYIHTCIHSYVHTFHT